VVAPTFEHQDIDAFRRELTGKQATAEASPDYDDGALAELCRHDQDRVT